MGFSFLHLHYLHKEGSSNPLGTDNVDFVSFMPYFYLKDLSGFFYILMPLYTYFVFFNPNVLGHSDNYIEANSLVTPVHIVPEWYFLPFYAILRAVPDKFFGVFLMFLSIFALFSLPFLGTKIPTAFNYHYARWFWFMVCFYILLGWLGAQVAEEPFITMSRIYTGAYFLQFALLYILSYEPADVTYEKSKSVV